MLLSGKINNKKTLTGYIIYNSLGYECGNVETINDNPVYAYAIKVNADYSELKRIGYYAKEKGNRQCKKTKLMMV